MSLSLFLSLSLSVLSNDIFIIYLLRFPWKKLHQVMQTKRNLSLRHHHQQQQLFYRVEHQQHHQMEVKRNQFNRLLFFNRVHNLHRRLCEMFRLHQHHQNRVVRQPQQRRQPSHHYVNNSMLLKHHHR